MAKLRVAAVGLGWVSLHRHLPVMDASKEFEVVGVIDRASGMAKRVAAERGYRHHAETSLLTQVPWLDEVDAVTISTAPMSHFSMIRQALVLGKHVLTEKPFAMTVAEGEELVRLAGEHDRRLAIVHNFQFARSTRKLLGDIQIGQIGTIQAVKAIQLGNPKRRLPKWYEELPLGLFYDESPHLLYLIRSVAGAVRLKRCLVFPNSVGLQTPSQIDAIFASPTLDCPISLHCNFESPVSEWYLVVFGSRRLGIVDIFRDIYVSLPNDGRHETAAVARTSVSAISQHLWQYLVSGIPHLTGRLFYGNNEVFHRFRQAVGGELDAFAPINAESALAVLRLQHAIVEQQEIMTSLAN